MITCIEQLMEPIEMFLIDAIFKIFEITMQAISHKIEYLFVY